jgi:paraquat-inducible protein B
MAERDTAVPPSTESRSIVKRRTRLSAVWIIPIVAAVAGAWVAVTQIMSEGPKITITFASADGLEAGKTKIRFKGVDVGTLTSMRLSTDHQQVIAAAQMAPRTEKFLVEDTQLWVVRPRISGANVTGLGTLISGAYIGMEIGHSQKDKRDFLALETPPVISGGAAGRFLVLKTSSLGSLDYGTPVFYRQLQVGEVASYALNQTGRDFNIKIFVRAPYDQFVTADSRFWQASGIDMQLSASGLRVQTQSLLSIMIGGIAFETPSTAQPSTPAEPETVFTLSQSRAEAFEARARNPQTYQLIFNESVRGLVPGAPVEFRGIQIGEVADVHAQVDLKNFGLAVPVTISLDPRRLGVKILDKSPGVNLDTMRRQLIDSLISHGARAQLRTGSLLTGALYVAFDFFPGSPPMTVNWSQNPVQLPTIPGQLQATEAILENIVKKLDKMPLQGIGDNVEKTLASLDLTLVTARSALTSASDTLTSANGVVQPNSAQLQQLNSTLQEFSRAARSLRLLADYLEQHPEALLRGKHQEAK